MKKVFIFLLILGFFSVTLQASITFAILSDNKSKIKTNIVTQIKQEIQSLTKGEFNTNFPVSKQFYGNSSNDKLERYFKALQNDANVDIIITIGLNASEIAKQSKILNKVTFAPFIFESVTASKNQSGIKNFNYLKLDISFEKELQNFLQITKFSNLSILIDDDFYKSFPKTINFIQEVTKKQNIKINFLRQKNPNDNLLDKIPNNTDAVMISALPKISAKAKKELIKGLISLKIPSYTLSPEISVEEGILASSLSEEMFKRRLRKLSLNIQAVLRGEEASKQDIIFKENHALTLNMQTAKEIGVYADFKLLRNIKLINEKQTNKENLSLEEVAKEVIEKNLSIIAGKIGVQIANKTVKEVESVFYPKLIANLSYTQLNDDNVYVEYGFYAKKSSEASIQLEQILFSEKALANLEIQKELEIAIKAQQEALELEVIKQATTVYLNVLVAQTYVKIANDNLALTQDNLKLARSRVDLGVSDRSDLYYWQSKISTTKQDLLSAKAKLSKAKDLLKRILHRPVEQDITIGTINLEKLHQLLGNQRLIKEVGNEKSYKQMADFFIKYALANAPELESVNAQLLAQKRQLLSQKRAYYTPSIVLAGEVNHVLDEQRSPISTFVLEDETNWQALLKLSLPLYEGGAKKARKEHTQLQIQQLNIKYLNQIENIKNNIWADLHNMKASYPAISLSKEAAITAKKSFEIIRANYAKGTRAMTDLLISQNAKLAADSASVNAIYQFLIDFTKLQRDIGNFDFFLNKEGYNTLSKNLEILLKTSKE